MALYHKKKVFDQKLFCVKFLVKILFLYITVKLDFDIDRKSAKPRSIRRRPHTYLHIPLKNIPQSLSQEFCASYFNFVLNRP